jgi:putative oxidoreductase
VISNLIWDEFPEADREAISVPINFSIWNGSGTSLTRQGKRQKLMKSLLAWLNHPPVDGPKSTLLLRLMAGGVFFWEGIIKFLFASQGIIRFTKLGIPFPEFNTNFVACLEIGGGLMLILGIGTRFIAIPFIIEMIVAILSTKISLYLGTFPLPLPPVAPTTGIWAVLHEGRSDWAQILTVTYLLINGPGRLSLDAWLRHPSKLSQEEFKKAG